MNKRLLVLGGLVALLALTGCLGGGGPSQDDLARNATYDWNTSVNGSITIEENEYRAVYRIYNRTEFQVFGRGDFGGDEPLSDMSALQFRFPNGTVVNASAFEVASNRDRTTLTLPGRDGRLAFSVDRNGKRFQTPVFVEGAYQVTLPPGTNVGIPLASNVVPGGYERETVDGQTRLTWEEMDSNTLVVRYYLDRDIWLFGGFLMIAIVLGVGGGLYYWRQIRTLAAQRSEHGLDIEEEDDPTDDGPPPGMR
jgi:hypothetical protein